MTKFVTNQNIELQFELASLGNRVLAFIIDALIISAYVFFWILIVSSLDFGDSVFIIFLPLLFYSLLFETFGNGQTPGKRAMNIRVVKLDGGAPHFSNYLLRWILRPIDIIFYGAIAIVSIIVTKNGQRIGDLAAGTTVVKVRSDVSLSDIQTLKRENHVLQFPQVKRLTDGQVELIRKTLRMRREALEGEATAELSHKIKEVLGVTTTMPDVQFLYTVLADYEYETSR